VIVLVLLLQSYVSVIVLALRHLAQQVCSTMIGSLIWSIPLLRCSGSGSWSQTHMALKSLVGEGKLGRDERPSFRCWLTVPDFSGSNKPRPNKEISILFFEAFGRQAPGQAKLLCRQTYILVALRSCQEGGFSLNFGWHSTDVSFWV